CHGDKLEGGEFTPLSGSEFLKAWNERSVRSLFERIRTTMPLDKAGSLTPAQTADITALILNVNKFPAGPSELPQTTAELEAIRILVVKPSTTP
ncbi:MAG: cytochrome c, partial [Vicinamibacterales bacterium]